MNKSGAWCQTNNMALITAQIQSMIKTTELNYLGAARWSYRVAYGLVRLTG